MQKLIIFMLLFSLYYIFLEICIFNLWIPHNAWYRILYVVLTSTNLPKVFCRFVFNHLTQDRSFSPAKLMISSHPFGTSDCVLSERTVLKYLLHFRNAINSEECGFLMNVILFGLQWSWVCMCVCYYDQTHKIRFWLWYISYLGMWTQINNLAF